MTSFKKALGLAVVGLSLLAGAAGAQAEDKADTLYLFSWSQYMDPALIKAFEKRYDVEVVQNYYESMPEMFAKLQAGGARQYDVIVPSNYYVPRLIETGLIQALDKSKLTHLDNIAKRFQDPAYDRQNRYTVPYQWGDTGIAYNTDKLGEAPESWAILFDPKLNSKYPFALATDAQVTLGAACAWLGKAYDCTGRDAWKAAAREVLATKARDNFAAFDDGTPVLRQLARGNVAAGMTFNGDFAYYKSENPEAFKNIKFVVPKEGTELWVDVMAVPKRAPHPDLAHKFIDFLLEAKNGAQLSNHTFYASPNAAARPYLDKLLTRAPAQPSAEQMKRLHYIPSLSGDDLQFVQQLWTEVQSR